MNCATTFILHNNKQDHRLYSKLKSQRKALVSKMNLLAHVAECVRLGIPIKKTITTYNELLVSTHKSPHQEIPGGENKEVSAKVRRAKN